MTMDLSPIIISLKTATLSIIITFFLGVAAAQFVFRLKSKTMKTILDGLFTLPLVLPPTVAGFFLLYIFGMRRPIGKFLIEYFAVKIAFSWGATVLAAVVISFPLMEMRSQPQLIRLLPMRMRFLLQNIQLKTYRSAFSSRKYKVKKILPLLAEARAAG